MSSDGARRSGRIPKQIAITLIGSDLEGRVFSERTKTVVLSRHGAGIISTFKLSPEQELVIRSEETRKEIEGRVVGQIGSNEDTYIYGVAFLDQNVNFWGIDFPDLSEAEQRASQTLLECSSCHARETADHSDLASDVMAINQSIVRFCQKCGSSTVWKQPIPGSLPGAALARAKHAQPPRSTSQQHLGSSGPGPSGEEVLDVPTRAEPPVAPAPWRDGKRPSSAADTPAAFPGAAWAEAQTAEPTETHAPSTSPRSAAEAELPSSDYTDTDSPAESPVSKPATGRPPIKEQENRRKHTRTRVTLRACVRRAGAMKDVVACEDMSRGGLRFKSTRKYEEKMLIEVAVPYSPGDEAIFVPAQIAYVEELPEQKMYRCGVMYLRSGK
jgi:hypothetical protein